MSTADLGLPGRGFSNFVNYDPFTEMPAEPFKGIVMASSSTNPGTALNVGSRTVWLNNGVLYRGNVNLEEDNLSRIQDLEDRVDDLEARMTAAETAITNIEILLSLWTPYFRGTSLTMTPSIPPEFGTVNAEISRAHRTITIAVAPRVATLSSPVTVIQFNAQIPTGYRPPVGSEVVVPVAFRSGGAVDTGLVGSMRIDSGGGVYFVRDSDASPAQFTGSSGWDYTLVATWITPEL
jgi:hypothetical protein